MQYVSSVMPVITMHDRCSVNIKDDLVNVGLWESNGSIFLSIYLSHPSCTTDKVMFLKAIMVNLWVTTPKSNIVPTPAKWTMFHLYLRLCIFLNPMLILVDRAAFSAGGHCKLMFLPKTNNISETLLPDVWLSLPLSVKMGIGFPGFLNPIHNCKTALQCTKSSLEWCFIYTH